MYILSREIEYNHSIFLSWYQSHYSNIFLAVLSLLVLLHSQHCFHHHNISCNLSPLNLQRLPIIFLGFRTCKHHRWGVPHRKDHCSSHHRLEHCSDLFFAGTTEIVLCQSTQPWKSRSQRSAHAPACTATVICVESHALHAPPPISVVLPLALTCHLCKSRACWRHYWYHSATSTLIADIICLCHLLTSFACVIRWRHLCLRHLIIDFFFQLWWLTFTWLTVDFWGSLTIDFCGTFHLSLEMCSHL